jgi:4-hydroxy-2-oxoheptanedioate aldolase
MQAPAKIEKLVPKTTLGFEKAEEGASQMRTNGLKKRLAEGQVAVGCLLAYNAPWLIEVLGLTGYDFVTIDLEHEPINDESVANLIRTADSVGLTSIVRMPSTERVVPFLSAGVQGVLVPDLRGREHAEQIVELTRYPPIGRRTYYTQTRVADYGVGIDERVWTQHANEELLVIAMIEDIAVAEQLDDILSVDGIDGFHIGTLDLAQSLGSPPPERLEEVVAEIVQRCRAAEKHVAVGVVTPWGIESVSKRVAQGVQMLNVPSAWLLTEAVGTFLAKVEERIPESQRVPTARSVSPNPYLVHARPGSAAN